MNKETQRIILASILITLVAYFYPTLWNNNSSNSDNLKDNSSSILNNNSKAEINDKAEINLNQKNIFAVEADDFVEEYIITINNGLYNTTISNASGGTILHSEMVEMEGENYKYLGKSIPENLKGLMYQPGNIHLENSYTDPVVLKGGNCTPCLGIYDEDTEKYYYLDDNFKIKTTNIKSNYFLEDDETLTLEFYYETHNAIINKSVTFYGGTYETDHNYYIDYKNNDSVSWYKLEVLWRGGMLPIDQDDYDWISGNAMIGQADETESIKVNDEQKIQREEFLGNTDWASVRTKYFIAALLDKNNAADFATMTGFLNNQYGSPSYDVSLGYQGGPSKLNTSIYLGPLDIDHISLLNNTLDETINFGFAIVRPIGKFVLWFLKLIHNTFNLNYGLCLIIFAAVIQVLTSPLTKKTYESSQKMQEVQPLVKKIQEDLKNDPQKMNQEVMKIYQEKGVNPLGGCLPLLLQMPLLMAIFSVFRDTIEFRGASFLFWINDLSQPDIIFHLPFNIPLYGDHVAFLPILMGISIFLTQKLSMATMDAAQKPMMYAMNGFFILIFNGFPAGLNLYYTVYNLLNYFQQKKIRSNNN